MKQHVSIVTLGVRDLGRAKDFYERLGWTITARENDWIAFAYGDGSSSLALYPWDGLAQDAASPADVTSGFRGVTFAYGVGSEQRVGQVLAEARNAGATIVKPAQPTPWGGYNGYFADPDGHLWEVVKLENYRAE